MICGGKLKSIIQEKKECYKCHIKSNLHLHHVVYGKNRKKADKDGLTVYLCYEHHEGTYGVHGKYGHELDMKLKQIAQKKWQDYYKKTEEDFIKRYRKSYI